MEALLILLAMAVAAAIIYLIYRIAKEFERIAIMKGHTEKRFFWYSFLLGAIGWAMVIALPEASGSEGSAGCAGSEDVQPARAKIIASASSRETILFLFISVQSFLLSHSLRGCFAHYVLLYHNGQGEIVFR